jgi:hypothetical protein
MWVAGQRHAPADYPREIDPVPILQEAGCTTGQVWTDAEYLAPAEIRSPDCPARNSHCTDRDIPAHYPFVGGM